MTPLGIIVLDTNVLSELMRATPDRHVETWARAVPPDLIYTTSVTLAEVRFGIARLAAGRRRDELASAADDVFATFADRVLPFDNGAASHYANIAVERERRSAPIAGFDAQIAAI
ncbi:MAG: type II toxin-antitoxin system VapC family toxin, partial [Antricoccus sp.]